MNANVGKTIATRLKALGKTQGWLAEAVGVSVNAVSRWTKTGKISRENAVEVARWLDLSLDQLLGGDAPASPELRVEPSRLERLDEKEGALLQLYRNSSDAGQLMIFTQARLVAEQMPRLTTLTKYQS